MMYQIPSSIARETLYSLNIVILPDFQYPFEEYPYIHDISPALIAGLHPMI
jgi:hypothetical protein